MTYHLEVLIYEGIYNALQKDLEADMERSEEEKLFDAWLRESITVVQYQRFKLFMVGLFIFKIARTESIDYSSADESIKASQKKLEKSMKIPHQNALSNVKWQIESGDSCVYVWQLLSGRTPR